MSLRSDFVRLIALKNGVPSLWWHGWFHEQIASGPVSPPCPVVLTWSHTGVPGSIGAHAETAEAASATGASAGEGGGGASHAAKPRVRVQSKGERRAKVIVFMGA